MKVRGVTVYYDNESFNILNKYACAQTDDREIYINIEHHKSAVGLIDTIVHELLHIKNPKLKHGAKFHNTINDIIVLDI